MLAIIHMNMYHREIMAMILFHNVQMWEVLAMEIPLTQLLILYIITTLNNLAVVMETRRMAMSSTNKLVLVMTM
ncbi:unnamed protein product [Meloidogyne enterolobii]|uniref:Uncharacterized protein n=1 Tax=Meloidogyne enterolobii TaxID=390850 RepID=A0ACB1AQH7_MELEN